MGIIDKQVQGMCDLLDDVHAARAQALSVHMTCIQDCKNLVKDIQRSQESFEDKCTTDLRLLKEKVDMVLGPDAEILQEQLHNLKDSVEGISVSFQQLYHQIQQMPQANTAETSERCSELEEHCSALESRLADAFRRLTATLDCHGGLTQSIQNLQLDRRESDRMPSALGKMTCVQGAVEVVGEPFELLMKECAMPDQEYDNQLEVTKNEQVWHLTDFEQKSTRGSKQESNQRVGRPKGFEKASSIVELVRTMPSQQVTRSYHTTNSSASGNPTSYYVARARAGAAIGRARSMSARVPLRPAVQARLVGCR